MTGPSPYSRVRAYRLTAVYVATFALTAAVVAYGAFLVGRVLPDQVRLPAVAVALVLLLFAAGDLRLGPVRTLSPRRQTDPTWAHRFGLARATALWGFDIGTTLTTIKMTSLYWAAFALVLTGPGARLHLVVVLFAAGYLAAHLLVVLGITRNGAVDGAVARLNELPTHVRITSGILLAVVGLVMLVQATTA